MKLTESFILTLTFALMLDAVACSQVATQSPSFTGGMDSYPESAKGVRHRTILIRPVQASAEMPSRLFPATEKLLPGAAAPIFLRMNWEASPNLRLMDELHNNDWLSRPIEELNFNDRDTRDLLRLNELRRAAFRQRAEWEYPIYESPPMEVMLYDVQGSRLYNKTLALMARIDLLKGDIAAAEDKICIAIGIANHISETPLIICRMMQAIHSMVAFRVVEELIQHPRAPNYYWDLTSLPRPLVATKDAIRFESAIIAQSLPELRNLDLVETLSQWERIVTKIDNALVFLAADQGKEIRKLRSSNSNEFRIAEDWVTLSRERLPKVQPQLAASVAKMSDAEVSVRYWWHQVQARTQSHLRWGLLEMDQAIPRLQTDAARLQKELPDEILVSQLDQHILPLLTLVVDLEQRIAILRTVESIRDWCARHPGKLPNTLKDLDLPAPSDPLTRNDLLYSAAPDGRTALLRSGISSYTTTDNANAAKNHGTQFVLRLAD